MSRNYTTLLRGYGIHPIEVDRKEEIYIRDEIGRIRKVRTYVVNTISARGEYSYTIYGKHIYEKTNKKIEGVSIYEKPKK